MKNLMLGTAMAVVLGASASAQDLFRTEMDPVAITASEFIGKRVYASEAALDADEYAGVQEGWDDIGEINDVVLTRDGKVDAVLVDIGGFLGMGERQVAVGMESIRFVSDGGTADDLSDFFLVVNADRTILEGAPEFVRTGAVQNETTATTAESGQTVDPAANTAPAVVEGQATTEAEVATDGTATGTAVEPATGTDGAVATTEGAADPATTTAADGTKTLASDAYDAVDQAGITSEQLMGVRVYGPNDEDVGEVSDLVLDDKGAPAKVIVDVGGFLGIGEKPVAIDLTEMKLVRATEGGTLRAYVQMTQEQLEGLPAASL